MSLIKVENDVEIEMEVVEDELKESGTGCRNRRGGCGGHA